MSKVEELRLKFPKIKEVTFNKLVAGDTTPTKKYLEYMLIIWSLKSVGGYTYISSTDVLIKEVQRFNALLPYNHESKDIYATTFRHFANLRSFNDKIEELKNDKSFVREEHVDVIYEDDEILFVVPKTFTGSMKYGSGTRWCTASKNNQSIFTRYSRAGCLAYLIDKKNKKANNYNKIAFYEEKGLSLFGEVIIYNAYDTNVSERAVINAGWNPEKLTELALMYRLFSQKYKEIKKSKERVRSVLDFMKTLDVDNLDKDLEVVRRQNDHDFKNFQDIIEKFIKKVEKSL